MTSPLHPNPGIARELADLLEAAASSRFGARHHRDAVAHAIALGAVWVTRTWLGRLRITDAGRAALERHETAMHAPRRQTSQRFADHERYTSPFRPSLSSAPVAARREEEERAARRRRESESSICSAPAFEPPSFFDSSPSPSPSPTPDPSPSFEGGGGDFGGGGASGEW